MYSTNGTNNFISVKSKVVIILIPICAYVKPQSSTTTSFYSCPGSSIKALTTSRIFGVFTFCNLDIILFIYFCCGKVHFHIVNPPMATSYPAGATQNKRYSLNVSHYAQCKQYPESLAEQGLVRALNILGGDAHVVDRTII